MKRPVDADTLYHDYARQILLQFDIFASKKCAGGENEKCRRGISNGVIALWRNEARLKEKSHRS